MVSHRDLVHAPPGMIAKSNVIVDKVRITDANCEDHTVNHARRTRGNPSRVMNGHSKDGLLRHVLSEEEERLVK